MNFRFAILLWALGLTSCSLIIEGIYGMKSPEKLNDQTIIRYASNYNIPLADNYKLDTSYVKFLFSRDTIKYKEQIKNHYQPLQALYYDKSGQLKSFQVNCFTGGFPNLNWQRDEIMTTFPPQAQAPIDSLIPLELQLKYLQPLPQTKIIAVKNYEYILIVYWNRFMGRQSKRLIHFVQKNLELAGDKKVKIIYANTDDFFAPSEIEKK